MSYLKKLLVLLVLVSLAVAGTWTVAFTGTVSQLVLTSPNGGETWGAGSTHDINWSSVGEIADVKLEYSANGGTDWATIIATTPNSGSFSWTLPGSPSTDSLVRVSDAAAPSIFDTSDATFSIAQTIPTSERLALIAFYNATTGDLWSNNDGWKTPPLAPDGFALPGTEETWAGVTVDVANSTVVTLNLTYNSLSGSIPSEIGDLDGLQYLDLSGNSLTGPIPTELGGLTNLQYLSLYSNQLNGAIPGSLGSLTNLNTLMLFQNQLSGSIPAELGGLTNLYILHLGDNELSGAIPAALSGLINAQQVVLNSNRLTGTIPAELGGMVNLYYLYVNGNQLAGPIPTSMTGMVSLEPGGLNLGYNALYTSDPTLIAFLNSKNPGWTLTQTIAPTGTTATALDGARILVSWLPIAYTADAGSYRIFSSLDPGGPYTAAGQTANKTVSSAEISGLTPGETYYFVVRAHTNAHANNPGAVESGNSTEAWAVAWTKLHPRIAGVVRIDGLPQPGVVMSGLDGSPITDSNGAYEVTVDAGWSGTVTPTLVGHTFDPAFRTYSILNDDQLGQDYAAAWITFPLSGSVTVGATGLAGVTMTGLPHSPVTDASGNYTDLVNYGWSGTVTPTHSYYTFDPVSQAYTNVTANIAGQNYTASLITTPQRQALIALYDYTNGDNWTNNSGWKTPPLYPDGFAMPGTEGTWRGLTVDGGTQAVTQIWLENNNLSGTIPAALGNLNGLQGLHLTGNKLSGTIPPEIANLSSLIELGLGSNRLTGTIPSALGNMTHLNFLYLYDNQLNGPIPANLGNMTNLIRLYLQQNPLGGTIPPELGNLANLQTLHLGADLLTGSVPAALGTLSSLQGLYLGDNLLTGSIPPELGNLNNLAYLHFERNNLSGSIPPELGRLTHLEQLSIQRSHLTGQIPAELGDCTALQSLDLQDNQLSGSIPASLGNLTNLIELYLHVNQLTGTIPASLGNLANLQYFSLMGNQVSGSIPASFGNLTQLRGLELVSNQLSGTIPAELGNLVNLSSLRLRGNQLTGPIPPSLVNLTALYGPATDIGYNALYTSDEALIAFLNSKDDDWASTQTIAPTQLTATSLEGANILVSWLPIPYTGDAGHYQVYSSQTSGSGYVLAGQTENKTTTSVNLSGLTPGVTYYFVVQTHTDPHADNANMVASEYSTEASATAWLQLTVQISGTVALGGSPLAGVVMSGLTGSPVTNASGFYTGTEAAGWSGTVTPALEGYTFAPALRIYTGLTADQTDQDYVATPVVVPSITLTSPNGGESWAMGSTHAVTWIQTGLTGSATVDLYKGGVYQKTLGSAAAATGSFSWTIAPTETVGTVYRVLVWQGSVSDESDADFGLVRTVRVDFNRDGQEDLLWRYHGEGGYNRAWFLGSTGEGTIPLMPASAALTTDRFPSAKASRTVLSDPRDIGAVSERKETELTKEAEAVMGTLARPGSGVAAVDDPRRAGRLTSVPGDPTSSLRLADPRQMTLAVIAAASSDGLASVAAKVILGGADVMPVGDLNWKIVGTGDFNNDGKVDILWRNVSSGTNVVWLMNGTDWAGSVELLPVGDQSWQIVGTGDFNRDTHVDILWRNSASGENVVWYMNGTDWVGSAVLLGVSDQNWQIVGTGDFNKDGNVDILWRYNGAGGYNVVWHMNDATWIGSAELIPVGDTAWQIAGTGDYNNDGSLDILWRYNGPGGYNYIWYMNGVTWSGGGDLIPVGDLTWRIVSR